MTDGGKEMLSRGAAASIANVVLPLAVIWLVSLPAIAEALAAAASFHADTNSFRVDIGVIAARELRQRPEFIDRHKDFHGQALYAPDMHHLTVALSDRDTGRRIPDATVIAAIRHKREKVERPLERMAIDGTISYGNFFRMAEPGTYEISLKIYRPQANAAEEANFSYEKPQP